MTNKAKSTPPSVHMKRINQMIIEEDRAKNPEQEDQDARNRLIVTAVRLWLGAVYQHATELEELAQTKKLSVIAQGARAQAFILRQAANRLSTILREPERAARHLRQPW